MASLISILDGSNAYHSSNLSFKVIATDHADNSVCLNGQDAISYLMSNLFAGFVNNNVSGKDSGILPPGLKILGQNYVVFERPPSYQNVFYNIDKVHSEMSDLNTYLFRIAVPWQVYVAIFDTNYYLSDVYMFFSPTSLLSKSQPLYLPPIPNFYTNGSLCRPMFSEMEEIERYPKNLSGVISAAYDWIWNNGTNNDLNEAVVHVNLQLIHHAKLPLTETIFKHISSEDYSKLFYNPYAMYYSSAQVLTIFRSWEQIPLEKILDIKWPVPSKDQHFNQSFYVNHDHNLVDHPHYYDWLLEWACSYYEDEPSERIDYIVDNGEYDPDAYYQYVVEQNKITPFPSRYEQRTCQDVINDHITDDVFYGSVKSRYNTFISNAFALKDIQQNA
jgi:hypothetical protein